MSNVSVSRYFAEVPGNTVLTKPFTPANGEELAIDICYGQSGNSPDTVVAIIWDEPTDNVVLYCTHQSGLDNHVNFSVTGDNTKKIEIKLINNSDTAIFLGAGWTT